MQEREKRQADSLTDAYKTANSDWRGWSGPVCWFIASIPTKWEIEGNMYNLDYTTKPTAYAYAQVTGKPLVS